MTNLEKAAQQYNRMVTLGEKTRIEMMETLERRYGFDIAFTTMVIIK